ncbi:hypothetical protein L209DRAFT_135001 [Thermothelomyces heterothallicus CBS 203.75]
MEPRGNRRHFHPSLPTRRIGGSKSEAKGLVTLVVCCLLSRDGPLTTCRRLRPLKRKRAVIPAKPPACTEPSPQVLTSGLTRCSGAANRTHCLYSVSTYLCSTYIRT